MWWLFSEFRNELQSSVNWWPLLAKTEIRNQRQVGNVSGDRAWLTVNRPSGKKCWKLSWSTLTWHLGYALCILSFSHLKFHPKSGHYFLQKILIVLLPDIKNLTRCPKELIYFKLNKAFEERRQSWAISSILNWTSPRAALALPN